MLCPVSERIAPKCAPCACLIAHPARNNTLTLRMFNRAGCVYRVICGEAKDVVVMMKNRSLSHVYYNNVSLNGVSRSV